jgi:hypothetical protein
MTMFGFVLQATIGGDDLSMHALLICCASTSASCTHLQHVLEMMEIEKLWVQEDEEKHWRQNKDVKLIALINHHGDINTTASGVHAERTFRPAGCMMSSLGDQVCVQGAVDLNDEQPIQTGSFLKMMEINTNQPRIQEEKQGRDQDWDDEILTIGSNHENAALIVIVLLLIAQAAANGCQSTLQPGGTAQVGPSCPQKANATAPIRYRTSRQPGMLTRACLLMMILQPAMAQGAPSSSSFSTD